MLAQGAQIRLRATNSSGSWRTPELGLDSRPGNRLRARRPGRFGQCSNVVLVFKRRLVLPARIDNWSLTSLQQRLVKTGGRLVRHARYYWLLLAESYLTKRLFGSMLRRIWALPVPTG
jgi:hypothetical protein